MKKITALVMTIVLFSSCGNNTKESNSNEQKSNTETEKNTTMKKVLFVLTSHEDLGNTGEKTGFWIEEFSTPY